MSYLRKYKPTLISIFDVPISFILIFVYLNYYIEISVFLNFIIALATSIALFFLSFIPLLNISLSAIYSFLWTYIVYYFTNGIAPIQEIYSSDWKYIVLGVIFIVFEYIHLINHYHYNKMEQQEFTGMLVENSYNLQEECKRLQQNNDNIQGKSIQINLLHKHNEILKEENEMLNRKIKTLEDKIDILSPKEYPRSNFTDYQKGKFSKQKSSVYDSPDEKRLDDILYSIINDYQLGKNFGVRVLVQQPLANYVEALDQNNKKGEINKKINNKNRWTRFDFIIEIRKDHQPLLAIELDGPSHNSEEQKRRDEYKNGACDALNLPLIRIPYGEDNTKIDNDFIKDNYEEQIIKKIIFALKKKGHSKEKILKIYNGKNPHDLMIQKCL